MERAPIIVNVFVGSLGDLVQIPIAKYAADLGKSVSTVRGWAEAGELPGAVKKGNRWVIDPLLAVVVGVSSTSAKEGEESQSRGIVRDRGGKGPAGKVDRKSKDSGAAIDF